MKILFIGTVEFSFHTLERVIDLGGDVVGVVTRPFSKINSDFMDLSPLCTERGIPYRFTEDVNSPETLNWIRSVNPEVIFCFGWSSLLKEELLGIPSAGVIGYHPAELPQNRGRHPIIWALVLGLKRTASTFFFMDGGADSGDLLSQRVIEICYEDDARTLYDKVTATALEQIAEFLPQLEAGTFRRVPQDASRANLWRKRSKEDGKIDFRMSSRAVYYLVRALRSPYVGAYLLHGGREVKVWGVEEADFGPENLEPGKILRIEGERVTVKCGEKAVVLTEHEFEALPREGEYL